MSKKSRLKRRKFDLLRHEFVSFVCSQCGICSKTSTVDFCYEGNYTDDPKTFMKDVLPKLKEIRSTLLTHDLPQPIQSDSEFEFLLEEAFCASNICGNSGVSAGASCPNKIGCLHALRAQIQCLGMRVVSSKNNRGRNKNFVAKNKTKKRKMQIVTPATPTFFCNDRFREEVNEIINGNNPEQQNKGKGCSGIS